MTRIRRRRRIWIMRSRIRIRKRIWIRRRIRIIMRRISARISERKGELQLGLGGEGRLGL